MEIPSQDWTPSIAPDDVVGFRKAAGHGLGRAHQWLRQFDAAPFIEAVEHLCLHNTAYDPQCEGSRADYVYELIQLTGNPDHFAEVTVQGVLESGEHWNLYHLFHLARLFAQDGHIHARDAIYDRFVRNDGPYLFAGDEQILALDGINGLLFVLDQMGQWIKQYPEYWADNSLINQAEYELGEAAVRSAVEEAARTNPNIQHYLDRAAQRPTMSHSDYRKWTYAALRDRIRGEASAVPPTLAGWGKHASDDDLLAAADDFLAVTERDLVLRYLKIFSLRRFPRTHDRLLKLARSDDPEIRTASLRALRHITHLSVRELAQGLITQQQADGDVVRLLVRNYQVDDSQLVEYALVSTQAEEDTYHWCAHGASDVFAANPSPHALPSLLHVYEHCRCSIARLSAVEVLKEQSLMPDWMQNECRTDANEYIRELVDI